MTNRTYPEEGELWFHPTSRSTYMIHSRTENGWVRYFSDHHAQLHDCYPLWTQPTDRFMSIYEKVTV